MFVLFSFLFAVPQSARVLFNASFAWCLQYRFYKVIEIIDTLFKFL